MGGSLVGTPQKPLSSEQEVAPGRLFVCRAGSGQELWAPGRGWGAQPEPSFIAWGVEGALGGGGQWGCPRCGWASQGATGRPRTPCGGRAGPGAAWLRAPWCQQRTRSPVQGGDASGLSGRCRWPARGWPGPVLVLSLPGALQRQQSPLPSPITTAALAMSSGGLEGPAAAGRRGSPLLVGGRGGFSWATAPPGARPTSLGQSSSVCFLHSMDLV